MQLRFFRRWYGNSDLSGTTRAKIETDEPYDEDWELRHKIAWNSPVINRELTLALSIEKALYRPYSTYLVDAIESDFWEHDLHRIDAALEDIAQIEQGEIETAGWGNDAFSHLITRKDVTFEHAVFGECEAWPIWSCPLAHYKAALEGWRTFLSMPDDINTELIIELPD